MYHRIFLDARRHGKGLLLITMTLVSIWLAPVERSAFSAANDEPVCKAVPANTGIKLFWQYCRWKQVTQG